MEWNGMSAQVIARMTTNEADWHSARREASDKCRLVSRVLHKK